MLTVIIVISLAMAFFVVFFAFFPIRVTWFYKKADPDDDATPVRRRPRRRFQKRKPRGSGDDFEVYDDAEL